MNYSVKETYNKLANDYEHNVDTKSLFNTEYERPAMMRLLPADLKDKRILDAGCAAGWYTSQLVNLGANVTATDISPKMVEATKRRIDENADVLCLDLEKELPFEDESFDLIVSSLVMHYLKDWSKPFSEFRRILKPNGTLLFSIHHPFMDIKLSENGNYFSTEFLVDQWKREGKLIDVPFYRRPLQEILNETLAYFSLVKVVEPQPTKAFQLMEPDKYERLMKNPHFFIGKAVRNK
ncbi:class I SAM-dependent methyltransferase [Psychrobacillus soli]|uniref:Class I SAM-dependent methyltransferase n=1 Tax=Psychrobacillus soli TaxID=1543965 RepID=A0A544TKM6_9BACI|nr:class I SAM-dependent methyltransferase [Psychrobacillus soli]TQR17993.1 class I SAM-dependent methyltransferase [Psychrobacillus soli]